MKGFKIMATIRQKIRNFSLSEEDRLLRKHDIVEKGGALTDVGRRVLCDFVFEEYKDRIVEAVAKVDEEEKATKSK